MNYQRPIVACLITIFLLSVSTLSLGDETTVPAEQKQKSANHADPNATAADGNSPLNLAVSNGASTVLIQFLISRGAHVNFVGAAGSALQVAAIQDNVEAVRCLLAHGADPGLVDLDAAAEESVELLRESLMDRELDKSPRAVTNFPSARGACSPAAVGQACFLIISFH